MPMQRSTSHTPIVASVYGMAWCLAFAQHASGAPSQSGEPTASDAQPGLYRVGVPEASPPAVAATLGYGFTESQQATDGAHHRLSLRLAGSLQPLRWLSLAPVLDGRYDIHRNDSGATIDGALSARAFGKVGSFDLGGELRGWVPGAEQASTMLDAASLDTRFLFGFVRDRVHFAATAGYRLDRSGAAGKHAASYSFDDRLALGLSDFDAVLLGLGAGVHLGATELLLETSADVLVGKGAPSFGYSPLRVAGGARQALSRTLGLELLAVGSLSARPDLSPGAPLVPVEPRLSIFAGVRYRFLPPAAATSASPEPAAATAAKPAPVPGVAPSDTSIDVVVRDEENNPVPAAAITLLFDQGQQTLVRDETGHYRQEHVPAGTARLRVEASGFEPLEQAVTATAGVPLTLELRLKALPAPSQVRGVVRSLNGTGVKAHVRVEPVGIEIDTDATGTFQLDVPPGAYEVVIEAPGYATQRRKVQLDAQGVVILNADLVRQR